MNRKIDKPVLEKPIVGGSKDVWGDILNVNIDNTEKFHTQLLSDLETKDAELARLERDKANKSDLPDLVHPIVDNYVESSVKPTINEYIDSTSKPAINSHVESKKQELNSYVNTTNKPELDKYTKAKEGELDTHTGKKKSELDVYEKAKEGQLDSHTNTKKEELNQYTIQKQGQLDEYTVAKKGELDSHTIEKKNELNTHEKAKEKELDSYVTTVNKPELDKYTNIKKEELNAHTKAKESEITQVTVTKKQEITAHGASELDKFNQGAKQETDKQIGRVIAEGDVQVQRVKDESNGVIPRIEKLESGKVSKSGDTMTGKLIAKANIELSMPISKQPGFMIKDENGSYKGGCFIETDGSLVFRNYTSSKSIALHPNGNAIFQANNLKTNSKEVVSAINELNSTKFSYRKTVNDIDYNELVEDGIYCGYRGLKNAAINGISVTDVKSYQPDWLIQKQYVPTGDGKYYEYARTKYGGEDWSDWVQMYHTGTKEFNSLAIESSVGNHIILKRSGELKGSLTSNQDGIALYNEKSGKMIELKDDGSVKIPDNSAQFVGVSSNLDDIKDSGWYHTPREASAAPTTEYFIVNSFFEIPSTKAVQHQLAYATLKSGYIYHRLVGEDWVRMANENDINDLKKETVELLNGNSGIKDVFYIQDVGKKEIGKGYLDKVTKELYICLVENEDTDIKLGKFELATNIENRFRLMRLEQKIGMYQYVYGIKELNVSRDENSSSPELTYTQK